MKLPPMPEPGTRTDWHHDGYGKPAYTEDQLRAYGAACYAAGMDRAAEVCATLWDLREDEPARMHAAKCADAIRAAKETP